MSHRVQLLAAAVACALSLSVTAANATTYDFGSLPQDTTVTPLTLNGATFTGSNDPGGFTVGANGLWSSLGSSVLSSGGVPATLNIAFGTAQTGLSFDVGTGDAYYISNGGDSVTVNAYNGSTLVATQSIVPVIPNGSLDFGPSGFFSLAGGTVFTSVSISAADSAGAESFAIAELASTPVPLPAAVWMLLSGLGGALGFSRRAMARI